MGYDLVAPQDYNTIKNSSGLKLLTRPAFNVAYVTMHQGPGSPMNDLKVRQAVAYGLNRKGLINSAAYPPGAVVAKEFQPPQLVRLREDGCQDLRVQPEQGEEPPELVELPCPVQGRLLVPVGGVAAVHA